ncbi:MAG: tryptophan synthase subunit alpha [Nitrospinae bacterium RIFCSPLOWO2_12_FULL_47_7]|nr:MAG: tryptophan synthase subunit alpha [Nitrospinae bacterium RIFCSPLOWO2_12_FULL_47_7]
MEEKFDELKEKKEKALIAFISAGDPDIDTTKSLVLEMERRGADIIELGVPFSDPLADGPTIQKSYLRALKGKTSLKKIIKMVKELRGRIGVPIVLMSSYNPVLRYGEDRFVNDAVISGIDGVIIPDLPPEESDNLCKIANQKGLDTIFLLAPTSDEERMKLICGRNCGFIYYISVTGITGARKSMSGDIGRMVKKIKRFTDLPVAVGFGVSTPEQAENIAKHSDGIIVGSAIVKIIEKSGQNKKRLVKDVGNFIGELKSAISFHRKDRGECRENILISL